MQVCSLSPQDLCPQPPRNALCWGLEKDGVRIGQCFALPSEAGWELVRFSVEEVWRGKGYGTYFFKQVLRRLDASPGVWVPESARRAREFFARFDFVPDGRTRTAPEGGTLCRLVRWQEPQINALSIAHDFLKSRVRPGDFVIDATAGRGRDTAFLCRLTGPQGRVLAVDIQPEAVDVTNALLRQKGYDGFARAILASHADLDRFAAPGTVDAVMFNLGYLPGGDHALFTSSDVSLPAIQKALTLLRPGGAMTICIYRGGAQREEEKEALFPFLQGLDPRRYTVLITDFANRSGMWPIPVCIVKHRA